MDAASWFAIINIGITVVVGAIGALLKSLWGAVKELQQADDELADKVQNIEVLVAGEYVKKTEMEAQWNRMFYKLDRIEAKIDMKADKP